jgi:predicted GNAT family N-acyltransferase
MALRYEVFCKEQGVPRHEERDGRDHDAVHLIAVADGQLLATCRLVFVGPTVQFSRLAVDQAARRFGIATELLRMTDAEARAGGANRIVLHAQTYARSLYDQAGYLVTGQEFVEADIRHVAMEKVL